ncbi:NUDIX domain-containing protein [Kribbella sp. CA-253562]|uniref:NUDIX domain-containing protein n=1 Tax=Kribbella sp. CA-253562 TaxID=3239942 RepID=UPI003D90775B
MIPIVNSDDQIVMFKNRDSVDPSTDIIRAASLILMDSNGKVLLARRSLNKKSEPGCWGEAVGGTVEGRETYLATLERETAEELGLQLPPTKLGPKTYTEGRPPYFTQWFLARTDIDINSLTLQAEEVDAVEWFTLQRLKSDSQENPEQFIAPIGTMVEIAEAFLSEPDTIAPPRAA